MSIGIYVGKHIPATINNKIQKYTDFFGIESKNTQIFLDLPLKLLLAIIRKQYADELYFWRTTSGQEIDCVLRKNGEITAIEFKYSENKTPFFSSTFTEKYQPAHTIGINHKNCVEKFGKFY